MARNFGRKPSKPRKPPGTSQQAFEVIERADSAMKKLFLDEPLTELELDALLHSDYLSPSVEAANVAGTPGAVSLYEPSKFGIAVASPFLFTSIEREILAYFGRHPELLHSLPSRKFEELVASVFRQSGFEVELTPESRDGGIDIIAVQKDGFAGSSLHLIECKRYLPHNTVGIGIVQRLLVLLCHKRDLAFTRRQHGHRGSVLSKAAAISSRKVVIDDGTWRCVRWAAARLVMRG